MLLPRKDMEEAESLLYKIVMGQVSDYMAHHPEHVTQRHKATLPLSLAKRIVGDLMSQDTRRNLRKRGY